MILPSCCITCSVETTIIVFGMKLGARWRTFSPGEATIPWLHSGHTLDTFSRTPDWMKHIFLLFSFIPCPSLIDCSVTWLMTNQGFGVYTLEDLWTVRWALMNINKYSNSTIIVQFIFSMQIPVNHLFSFFKWHWLYFRFLKRCHLCGGAPCCQSTKWSLYTLISNWWMPASI